MEPNKKILNEEELRKLSDKEFNKLIVRKYGTDWDPSKFKDDELLNNEFWRRLGSCQ